MVETNKYTNKHNKLQIKINFEFFQKRRVSNARNESKPTKKAMQHNTKPKKSMDSANNQSLQTMLEFVKNKSFTNKLDLVISFKKTA